MSKLRIVLNLSVLGALWGGYTAIAQVRDEPRRWRSALLIASAGISIALAVGGAIDKARERDAIERGEDPTAH